MKIVKTETVQLSKSEVTAINTAYIIMDGIFRDSESPVNKAAAFAVLEAIDQFIGRANIEQEDD